MEIKIKFSEFHDIQKIRSIFFSEKERLGAREFVSNRLEYTKDGYIKQPTLLQRIRYLCFFERHRFKITHSAVSGIGFNIEIEDLMTGDYEDLTDYSVW